MGCQKRQPISLTDWTGGMNKEKRHDTNGSRKIEILAPAGSYACFRAAVNAGADAVYAGGSRFGARAYADNFTEEEMIRAIREAHLFGKKLYLTVNTLLKEKEIRELYGYLRPFYENGLDAVIVQDIGVFEFIREYFPGLDIHVSTQMTVTDLYGAAFLEEQGASRIVPARELSLEEIRRIREGTSLEIECFVHGALCYCYSGQCLLSSMIGGRSGNRGQCAQPCRLPYTVNGQRKYFLSPKDICTLELIPEMIDAGIDSFKIEGRMKKPEYVAGVTAMYRKYIDLYLEHGRERYAVDGRDREMLMDLYNRGGSSSGYYQMHNGKKMMALDRPNHAGVPALKVLSQSGREVCGEALTDLSRGDVIGLPGERADYTLGKDVKKKERLTFLVSRNVRVRKGTVLSRIRSTRLLEELDRKYADTVKQRKISGSLILREGRKAELTVTASAVSCTVRTAATVQKAEKRPLQESEVRDRMKKTGNTPFAFESFEIMMDDDIFLPMQMLNQLRREALEQLEEKIAADFFRKVVGQTESAEGWKGTDASGRQPAPGKAGALSVLVETAEQLEELARYVEDTKEHRIVRVYPDTLMTGDFFEDPRIREILEKLEDSGIAVYPALPRIFRARLESRAREALRASESFPISGFLIRNYESFAFLRGEGFDKTVILDHNLYVFNRFAGKFWEKLQVSMYTAPLELNDSELEELGIRGGELVVYGNIPVMVSAQCIRKNSSGCTGEDGIMEIKDRYGNLFPVKNYCVPCYNVIYNTVPQWLGGQMKRIRELGPSVLRAQFTTEPPEKVGEILRMLAECQDRGRKNGSETEGQEPAHGIEAPEKYTQGHFKRGIL